MIRLAGRVSPKKPVNPHIFRHSRASYLASKISEAAMDQYLGWLQGSKMAATYVHLSGRGVDEALRKLQGLDKAGEETEEKTKLRVRICPRCHQKNSPIGKFCSRCGSVMDIKTALEIQEARSKADHIMTQLLEDPEVQELFKRKLVQMKIA